MQSALLSRLRVSRWTLVTQALGTMCLAMVVLLMLHDPPLDLLACTSRFLGCGYHSVRVGATQNLPTIQSACTFMLWAPPPPSLILSILYWCFLRHWRRMCRLRDEHG